ncbi:MAG: CDP-alcohol phosphatidyltransferase family protein [Kofleriaceae bacterium]|nr:CDP-alcohol phosphatidyltransferase family protein [Myxococcales bacterium]MCB9570691.1 CDP-alcohol phosphatidyltransferase family protein [Kofleriaceae bacterium]
MERLTILAPALLGITFLLVMFGVYSLLCALGRAPTVTGLERRRFSELFGPYMVRYALWMIRPLERALVVGGVTPNMITLLSVTMCMGSGAAIATGHLATGAWLYAFAGVTDILDGRLARATGKQSQAGALVDSVADRWGELAVFTGCAWYLRHDGWLLTAMLALAGSMMVSYTRARGEGLGLKLDGGMMQRAERMFVVAVGSMVGAWFAATPSQVDYAQPALGTALILCGALASFTALGRWLEGYKALLAAAQPDELRERREARAERPAENPMRITGEHTA